MFVSKDFFIKCVDYKLFNFEYFELPPALNGRLYENYLQ